MPMTTTGMKPEIQKWLTADQRLVAALTPIVRGGVAEIGALAKANAISSDVAALEFETSSFLTGTVGFHERGYPHAGEVRTYEGDGVAPEPFRHPVYGGPGWADGTTHPALGPASRATKPQIIAEAKAAVRKALS